MTQFWAAPNQGITHSILLLPDNAGNPPVLTVNVPLWLLGFVSSGGPNPVLGADRGELVMWPGARINVSDQDTLAIGYVDMFTCKDQVSKGIEVMQGGRLDQENSTFSDAETAITLRKGSRFTSFGGISTGTELIDRMKRRGFGARQGIF